MKYKLLALGVLTSFNLFISPVFAGGGLISWTDVTTSDSEYNAYRKSSVLPGTQYTIRPQVHLEDNSWCVNCPIKIKLENPQSNDYIAKSSDKTDENGTMYAKVISYVQGKRYAYAEVTMPDGTNYISSRLVLNYAGEGGYEPSQVIPAVTPEPSISPTPKPVLKSVIVSPTPTASPKNIEASPSADSNKKLEQKVENLEKELKETKQKQSFLEKRVEELVGIIESISKFFN